MPRNTLVRQVMTTDVLTFRPDDTVELAARSLSERRLGGAPVVDDVGAVVGLLLFGWVADASGSFAVAAWVVSVPVAISTIGYRFLPETRGLELEESAPEVA